ncbi:MAG: HisA/HisF-related TIM barrel protein, partial [Actinomycetota bacterium]
VSIQAAGGVRDEDETGALFEAGASRVVLGSAALADEHRVKAMLSAARERLVIGLEVDGERIRSRGRTPVDLSLKETLGWVVSAGFGLLLVTAVARVGERAGPDLGLVRRVCRAGRPVLAAGGVASLEDLRDLRAAGAAGAVVGSAWIEGSLDLAAAIAELAVGPSST